MNLLARAKMSSHLMIFSAPGKRLLSLHPTTALQQCDLYSTKTTTTRSSQKTQQLIKPKTKESSGPSSTTFCQRTRKQTEALATVWPKPGEIPYQAKVANFVNMIGYVELPVRFESASDGKHFATTVISLVNGGVRNSLMIPVVFEGDLAHVVSCHVKEKDFVFVSGQLSVDPVTLVSSDSSGKFHVVAENINFVEGSKNVHILDKKIGGSFSGVEIDRFGKHEAKVFEKMPKRVDDTDDDDDDDEPLVNADAESVPPAATLDRGNYESKLEKGDEKKGESVGKKKDADQIMNLWRDLVKSPLQWWDFRNHKTNGLVKERYPDFKQKVTGESLWISSAPKWILPGLGKLEFDVMDMKPKQVKDGAPDDSWKNLVENPDNWWDNRMKKKNPKAPDFKHKETGEVLWLDRSPGWVSSKLPTGIGKLEFVVMDVKPKQVKGGALDDSWKNLVENPDNWWDNRMNKKTPKAPDFKHKETGEGLWLNRSPGWVSSKLPPLRN